MFSNFEGSKPSNQSRWKSYPNYTTSWYDMGAKIFQSDKLRKRYNWGAKIFVVKQLRKRTKLRRTLLNIIKLVTDITGADFLLLKSMTKLCQTFLLHQKFVILLMEVKQFDPETISTSTNGDHEISEATEQTFNTATTVIEEKPSYETVEKGEREDKEMKVYQRVRTVVSKWSKAKKVK